MDSKILAGIAAIFERHGVRDVRIAWDDDTIYEAGFMISPADAERIDCDAVTREISAFLQNTTKVAVVPTTHPERYPPLVTSPSDSD